MKTFAERLQDCVDRGRLTGADLAAWFGRPYPTVRTWRLGLSEPWKPWREEAEQCLKTMEYLVRHKHFPMPSSYNALERRRYVKGLVNDFPNSRLPKTRPSR
jgi:hypothetical protein